MRDGPTLPARDPLQYGPSGRWSRTTAAGRGDLSRGCRPLACGVAPWANWNWLLAFWTWTRLPSPARSSSPDDLEATDFESHLCTLRDARAEARSGKPRILWCGGLVHWCVLHETQRHQAMRSFARPCRGDRPWRSTRYARGSD